MDELEPRSLHLSPFRPWPRVPFCHRLPPERTGEERSGAASSRLLLPIRQIPSSTNGLIALFDDSSGLLLRSHPPLFHLSTLIAGYRAISADLQLSNLPTFINAITNHHIAKKKNTSKRRNEKKKKKLLFLLSVFLFSVFLEEITMKGNQN